MTRASVFALSLVMAAAATLFAGTSGALADTTCTGVMTGATASTIPGFSGLKALSTLSGNVTVPSGASCTLMYYNVTGNVQGQNGANVTLAYVNVSGNVQVQNGGTLLINGYNEPSTIGGNVTATDCASALLEGNVTVGGNVTISSCVGGPNGFQGPGILIQGSFSCQSNVVVQSAAVPCLAWLGKVAGGATISSNASLTASDVSLVNVGGTLDCETNALTPTHVHGPSWVDGSAMGQCAGFATTTTSISNGPVTPAASCAALASLPASGFPAPITVIVSAVDTAASSSLPERCIVTGYVNDRISMVDSCEYQDRFEVALPLPAAWNGRFFAEGGGGTEGSVPAPTGANSGTGTAASNFGIVNGYAVATQDGGHENSQQTACPNGYGNANEFYLDPSGLIAKAYQSVQVTILNAKYLVAQYYGTSAAHSYWVGCSDGGGRGMAMSQNFPEYLDGIVAGDPGGNLQELELGTGVWDEQQLMNVYNTAVPALPTLAYATEPTPEYPEPILYPAFPSSDQALLETALLQACDALDGVADGVIDNVPACIARFNPATANYVSGGVTLPLQCPGAKNATCLSPAQVQAVIAINQGPRTAAGMTIKYPEGTGVPDYPDNTIPGFAYDGGWMTTQGIPSIAIGTATTPGANLHLSGMGYQGLTIPNPGLNTLSFNFNSASDIASLSSSSPDENAGTSLNMAKFIKYGHKIIWYHGLSDPRVPVVGMINYYNQLANQNGGFDAIQNFSRLYPVPNLGHCTGGATTDQFDALTPVVNWVENGTPPGPITGTGVNFTAATYQVGFVSGSPDNAPTTRNRLICPYPQQARFIGKTTLVSGVPVASNPSDLANAANYACINFVQTASHDFNGNHVSDILWRDTSNNIGMWLMNGPTISQSSVLGNVMALWSVVGQRDFNGNATSTSSVQAAPADILWRDTAGDVGIWLMNGTQIASSTVLGNVPTTWSVVGTGDFNGDTYGDILWRDTSGNLGIWFMNGTTISETAVVGNVPIAWSVAGADSKGDIFWFNNTTREVGMWVMSGANVVQTADFGSVPANWKIAGIGDFDGNGSTDILWRDTSGNVGIWLMNGTQIMSSTVLGNVPTNWNVAQTGDYNGDGMSDILWLDTSGNVGAWFMNGTTVSSTAQYGNVGTAWTPQSLSAE